MHVGQRGPRRIGSAAFRQQPAGICRTAKPDARMPLNGSVTMEANRAEFKLIQELFEAQARLRPRTIAVASREGTLTYGELNASANQLAWYLRRKGLAPNQLAAVYLERNLDVAVACLAILKAGGAYLPLDAESAEAAITRVLKDAAPSVVLTHERLRDRLPRIGEETVTLDRESQVIKQNAVGNPALRPLGLTPEHPACAAYTSGARGPQGLTIEHRQVTTILAALASWLPFQEGEVWALSHSSAFDISVWELWGALLFGGQLVIVPRPLVRTPAELYRLCCREGVTMLNQTAAGFKRLRQAQRNSADKSRLKVVIISSGALDLRDLGVPTGRSREEQSRPPVVGEPAEGTVRVEYYVLSTVRPESQSLECAAGLRVAQRRSVAISVLTDGTMRFDIERADRAVSPAMSRHRIADGHVPRRRGGQEVYR